MKVREQAVQALPSESMTFARRIDDLERKPGEK